MKTIRGYMRRGPDFKQNFQGWKVYAFRHDETDIPVTITVGHETREKKDGQPN